MKFLTLVQTSGDAICINFDHIVALSTDENCTKVWEAGDGDVYWRVKETVNEILAMLKEKE